MPRSKLVHESPAIFASPQALALSADGKLLYVADKGHEEIRVLVADNLDLLGEFGKSQLTLVEGVRFDNHNNLLVADTGNDRVIVYEVNGTSARQSTQLVDELSSVTSVCADQQNQYYATSTGQNQIVSYQQNRLKNIAGKSGLAIGEFSDPNDLLWHQQRLYVADSGNDRIQIFDAALSATNVLAGRAYKFNQPRRLASMESGHLVVVNRQSSTIVVIDQHQEVSLTFGPGELRRPCGAATRDNKIWVSDTENHRIVQYAVDFT